MLDFVVIGLATWRLSSLLVNEEGPWQLLEKLRYVSGVRYDERSTRYATTRFGEVFLCVWCLSIWVGIALGVAYWYTPQWTTIISWPLALSATAVIIEEWVNGKG